MQRKLKLIPLALSVAKRLVHPKHLGRAMSLQLKRKKHRRASNDAELQLIAQILPSGFLHYGYFDDPDRDPATISIADVFAAQHRYAEVLAEQITNSNQEVLDVGSGMGGLIRLLQSRGFKVAGLTPEHTQVHYIEKNFPGVPVYHSKFEEIDPTAHAGRYGTVVTSESLQYLKLDQALPLLRTVLRPGGRWVACDYFRTAEPEPELAAANRAKDSGHFYGEFRRRIEAAGWRVEHERDITENVLPTLRCAYMWGRSMGLPFLRFGFAKLRRKNPGVHYLLEDALADVESVLAEKLEIVNPESFAERKRYVLLTMTAA